MTDTVLDTPAIEGFASELVAQIRAQDTHGAWDRKSDSELLEPFIVDKEKRRAIPIIGDPDPDTLWRLELYYGALCLAIERRCGTMVSPMMKMSHEGFGRLVLLAGNLVAEGDQWRAIVIGRPPFTRGQVVVLRLRPGRAHDRLHEHAEHRRLHAGQSRIRFRPGRGDEAHG